MRVLKSLVIVMGVLIVGGIGLLGALVAGRMAKGPATAGAPFAAPPLTLPAGARIAAMSTGTDRVVLDLALADGSHELVVIDLANGRRLGVIPLRSGP
ncbi:MAG TPA: DUF6476 family protein [Stellaceae bacterium]|nr:DUF6476 family protein [Stellaceae bacterium]